MPPPRALTVPARNQAGTWLLTQSRVVEKLADVLEERGKELDALGLDEFAFLPFEKQKQVQRRFRDRRLESNDGGVRPGGLAEDQDQGRRPPHA